MQDQTYCVYIHRNIINDKRYIGQTSQNPVSRRWGFKGNGYKCNEHFYNAIQKYGWDNFEHIIYQDSLTLEEANEIEEELIIKYDTLNPEHGYNMKHGGSNGALLPEQIERLRLANTGKVMSEDSKRKLSESKMGHSVSEETRQILREKNLGHTHSEETKQKIAKKHIGKHWYNNGFENVFTYEKPEGYVEGMLVFKENITRNTPPFTEGHKENIRKTLRAKASELKNCVPVKCEETGEVYYSINEAARANNLDRRSLLRHLSGQYKHTHNLHFSYVDNEREVG